MQITKQKAHVAEDGTAAADPPVVLGPTAYRLIRLAAEMARYTVLLAFIAIFLIPFVMIAFWSLKSEIDIGLNPFGPPLPPRWDNIPRVWTIGHYSIYLPNTVIYAFTITTSVCLLSCLAGYALARIPFPGRQIAFNLFLIGMMVPFFSIMIPIYLLLRDLGMLGTRWGMIVPSIALEMPFGIFLMRAFFLSLPGELADAARIDGCNEWSVFGRVFLPLAGPGFTSLAVFEWIWTWNSFLLPLLFVTKDKLRPVGLAIFFFQQRYTLDRGLIATGVMVSILPVIVMYLVLQRKFVEGVTAGALK